jgi:FKBP12-rapamycin complex-associated protein
LVEGKIKFHGKFASMNMVGYILGLSDRHLNNIMVACSSCSLFHIDFGDCFEVAMNRKEFPETVPFRLTRIFVNAFAVSGVERTYRTCSENQS